jgi:bacterioferritin-associated ferredoxin
VIVCHCTGITDRDIRSLVRQGRAKTVSEIGRTLNALNECSAGLGCGGCRLAVEQIVQIVRQEERSRTEAVPTALAPAF